jgi:septum formation protein
MIKIILASISPRRKEILNYFDIPFEIVNPICKEDHLLTKNPKRLTRLLAQKKALSIPDNNNIIVAADTVVYCNNKIYNKPKNEQEAIKMLKSLSGKWHEVFTSICVRKNNKCFTGTEKTKVFFHKLTDKQIKMYLHKLSLYDKAGAYAIQQAGSIIVEKIDGCFFNVMGLPITTLRKLLKKAGIDLWEHLKP